jgi:hypothetical protein
MSRRNQEIVSDDEVGPTVVAGEKVKYKRHVAHKSQKSKLKQRPIHRRIRSANTNSSSNRSCAAVHKYIILAIAKPK